MPSDLAPLPGLDQPHKYLTKKDLDSVELFFRKYVNAKFRFDPDCGVVCKGPLYHYTTGENLIHVIESKEIWCTQVSCLNDTMEFTYAVDELQKRVQARLAAPHDAALNPFLAGLDQYLRAPDPDTTFLFVTCFSEDGDDLSQWRAYSGGEGGYAIAFDPVKLYESATSGESTAQFLIRVEYDEEGHDSILTDVLRQGEEFFMQLEGAARATTEDWAAEFVRYWLWNLQFLAPCLKHPKFANEHEWRLVYSLRPDDAKRMKFKQRPSMMTRHVPLRLKTPLPIEGIVVGPCRHPQLSRIAVGDLLKRADYDPDVVKVSLTQVPYRAI